MNNPYQAPASDIRLANTVTTDASSPFSRKGRFSRLSYIAWISIIGFAAQGFITLAMMALGQTENPMLMLAVTLLFQVPAIVCHAIFTIRRTHDIGKGGWWVALFMIPLINLYLWFKRGDDGENNFGAPRPTATFEKVIAYIFITLSIVAIIGGIVAVIAFRQHFL
ncbi:MAG: DUF805 domain-containing protein [Methylococcales bacterium]